MEKNRELHEAFPNEKVPARNRSLFAVWLKQTVQYDWEVNRILGLPCEGVCLEQSFGYVQRAVANPANSQPCIDTSNSDHSARTILIAKIQNKF